jgi:hypothetical protein
MGKVDRIAEPWGTRTPYGPGEHWPERTDLRLDDGVAPEDVDAWVQSATILHSNGDGLDIAVKDGRIVGAAGLVGGQHDASLLLELTKACHPQTLRQLRWANACLKANAAQIMVTP